jgi:hypothetical protein
VIQSDPVLALDIEFSRLEIFKPDIVNLNKNTSPISPNYGGSPLKVNKNDARHQSLNKQVIPPQTPTNPVSHF